MDTCSVVEARHVKTEFMPVDLLCQGKTNRVVGYKNGQFIDFDIEEALAMKKQISEYQYDISKSFAI